MPNSWNDSPDQGMRRAESNANQKSGLDGARLWDDQGAPGNTDDVHVLDLLQRLESESKNDMVPLPATYKQQPTKWAQWDPEISCAACHYLNPADQKFCGYCGSPLQARRAATPERAPATPQKMQEPRPAPPPEPVPPFVFEEETVEAAPVRREARSEVRLEASPELQERAFVARERDDSELEFLRYKTQGVAEPDRSWRIPLLMVVLAAAGFIGYRLYNGLGLLPMGENRPPATAKVVAPEPSSPAIDADSSASQTVQEPVASAKPAGVAARPKAPAPLRAETAAGVTPASQLARERVAAASAARPKIVESGAVGGREELAQAERYLSPSSRDSAEAARWLWKAVGKENGRAVLLLSDLYAKGDGVAKSCDQARLLLTIAAKKGNSDAASRLTTLDSCQ